MPRIAYHPWRNLIPAAPGVYVLYDGDTPMYVGSSVNLQARVTTHPHTGLFDHIEWMVCHPAKLEANERKLFDKLRPPLNIKRPKRQRYTRDYRREHSAIADAERPYNPPAILTGRTYTPEIWIGVGGRDLTPSHAAETAREAA